MDNDNMPQVKLVNTQQSLKHSADPKVSSQPSYYAPISLRIP